MTIQEAARLLNVPLSFLTKLLEEGKIPYTQEGSHRYLCYEDVMAYKKERDAKRSKILDELIQMSQEAGFYDEQMMEE